jgi:hypothetical protein
MEFIIGNSYSCTNNCTICSQTYLLNTTTGKCEKGIYNLSNFTNTTNSINLTNSTPALSNQTTSPFQQIYTPISINNSWFKHMIDYLTVNLTFIFQVSSSKFLTQVTIYSIILLDDL